MSQLRDLAGRVVANWEDQLTIPVSRAAMDDLGARITTAMREVQTAEQARCAGIARNLYRDDGLAEPERYIALEVAEAIEQETPRNMA